MKKLYTCIPVLLQLALLYLLPLFAQAQTCSNLKVTCTTSESRCMATGTITVQASGGSGNYNYKAVGPITTSFTSSSLITGLQPGVYKVIVRDITKACQTESDSIIVRGTYSDPRFILTKTNVTCAGNDGTITASNRQFGRAPFSYSIVAPSSAGVGTTNTTGFFSNLIPGAYAIQLKDSCGGIQVRRITIQSYQWWFDGVVVTKTDCTNADVLIRLKDNRGNLNTSSTSFTGFTYGVVDAPGDTTWYTTNKFSLFTGTKRSVTFVAKDPCGTLHRYVWNVPVNAQPSVSTIGISNTTCMQFTATVNGQKNLTNPQFLLFDSTNTQVATNTTGVFAHLAYGKYCIQVKDACYDTTIMRCFTKVKPVPSVNSTVAISGRACATFTATITGQRNLFGPSYCLYDSDNVLLNCNSTGTFPNLPYGSYCIKVTDSCTNAVINRCFTAVKPVAVLTNVSITGQNCTTFDVTASGTNLISPQYCLYDSLGNVVRCDTTATFSGVGHGSYCIRAISCGDTTAPVCFTGSAPKPNVATGVAAFNQACSTFTASITGQANWTTPQFCLFDSADVQIRCNSTGVFDSLAYGSYCIKITDGCYDTTVIRCFTQTRPLPAIKATLQQLNSTCSTFTAQVTDAQNLFDAKYCIYNAADSLIGCNNTGVFDSLDYGSYCVVATDGCTGAMLRVCQTFSYNYSITLATSKSCTIGSANVLVGFEDGSSPYAITVLDAVGSLVYSGTATEASKQIELPVLTTGEVYTVIGTDACGRSDTATIMPEASFVTKSITATGKCPSATWLNGSGDLKITASSNLGTVTPKLIKRDGSNFSKTHSSNSGTGYIFSDLKPASYIVEYSIQQCNTKLYDTFALQPYAYPVQGRSAIYQCDNQSIFLKADVAGGVGPYSYQIIGSEPDTPSIVSAAQTSATFNINTGTTYSLIRLRTIDACGNATLNDLSVLPLQNILITADTTCLFNNITLSVDTIEEARYSWYKKRDATDSVFLTSDKTYNIPFMRQQDIGTYICKVEMNNSCLTRLASFELTGDCGNVYLAAPLKLSGKVEAAGNSLRWSGTEQHFVQYYEVERKRSEHSAFTAAGRAYTAARTGANYTYVDTGLYQQAVLYRIKAVMQNGTIAYSNTISLQRDRHTAEVYPNPVHSILNIQISGATAGDYRIELFNTSGQMVYQKELKRVLSLRHQYERPKHLQSGMYLLKIINRTNGAVTHHRVLFD
jgi:hypothetical protein